MTGVPKPTPIEAFDLNLADARWLIQTAQVLQNQRARRMRKELRAAFGNALRLPARDHDLLDCFESQDLFVVIKPGSSIDRHHVGALDPLLRQSIVAGCAALETYIADAVCARIGLPIRQQGELPSRLGRISLTVADWKLIEDTYERRRRGLREKILVPTIREISSTAPNQVGILLSMLGIADWAKKVDSVRKVRQSETVDQLTALTARRNRIAHEGDRRGYGRSHITVSEARGHVDVAEGVARAIEMILAPVTGSGGE
jgi:hypothetical protein